MDFSNLVLGPAMAAFGQSVVVTPTASLPGAPTYPAIGVWSFKPVEIPLQDGTFHSTNQPHLGIRLADYPVAPKQGDGFSVNGTAYVVADIVPDGQGGADIELRNVQP